MVLVLRAEYLHWYLHGDVDLGVLADVQVTQQRISESVASEVPLHDDGNAVSPSHDQFFQLLPHPVVSST